MADNYGAVSIGTAATLIASANAQRISFIMTNEGATVYYGPDSSITAANCPHMIDDGTFGETPGGRHVYKGDFFGIVSAGTSTVYYWERTGKV